MDSKQTIIVGAGLAGMTCALKLQEAGVPYTIVSPNIGGRVCYKPEYEMNFGAVFYMQDYHHVKEILTPANAVLPSYFDLECHAALTRGYGVRSKAMMAAVPELLTFFKYLKTTFQPHYQSFKVACETIDMADAIAMDPYIKSLFGMTAEQLIEKEAFPKAADALVSQFVHACTGAAIRDLNALDYLVCAMGIIDNATRFTFDSEAMAQRLAQGCGNVELASVQSVERIEGGWRVTTDAGATFEGDNLVMASPANITRDLLEPVIGAYDIRTASKLYAYKVRGDIRNEYAAHDLHLFDESIPLINIGKRPDGCYEVFTCEPMEMDAFFYRYEVLHSEDWPYALFISPSIVLKQNLGDGLYRIGDHNSLGMEPAAISGVYAANCILGLAQNPPVDALPGQRVLDKKGEVAVGLPASYDNIAEDGTVLYLDEARRARKEQPLKPLFKNGPDGLGIKDFLVTHLSARDWNWKLILAVFRLIVKGSELMRDPDTAKSYIYKNLMMFEPRHTGYSWGSIYNLHVDSDEQVPGTYIYNEACKAAASGDADARALVEEFDKADTVTGILNRAVKAEHAEEKCGVMAAVNDAAAGKRATINVDEVIYKDASKVTVPMDLVKKAIMEASFIGGMKTCLCRDGQDCQNYPHDLACLFINQAGKVAVEHGMAVEFTKEEALARVDRAAELGLTCQSLWVQLEQLIWGFKNNEMDAFLEICFCCPCCCVALNLSSNATRDVKRRFSPTGWTAVVDNGKCVGCKTCAAGLCPQDAIHFRESDGKMVVDQENCVGCGLCKTRCPHGAISVKQTMPMRDSMYDYFREEGRLEIVPGPSFS